MGKENLIDVIVETPKGSRQKFDFSPVSEQFELKKLLPAGMSFPFDFGFIPNTIGGDGDPIDVLIISELGTFTGCLVKCRVIGAISAEQKERNGKKMRNDRIIAIPETSIEYAKINSIADLPNGLLAQTEAFFISYNKQAGKKFNPIAHVSPAKANKLIKESQGNVPKKVLVEVFLPQVDNPAGQKKLSQLEHALVKRFGGLTAYTRGPAKGKWKKGQSEQQDEVVVLEIMSHSFDGKYWKKIKSDLEKLLHQTEVLIRYSRISQLGTD